MNFETLLLNCAAKAYPEPRTELHDDIARQAMAWIASVLKPADTILDVGCGSAFVPLCFNRRDTGPWP